MPFIQKTLDSLASTAISPDMLTAASCKRSLPFVSYRPVLPATTCHGWQQCPRRWSSLLGPQGSGSESQIIFSGIQPTGVPHLGNYLGALREWVKLQETAPKETRMFFSIVDLHALTVPQGAQKLKTWRKEGFATLLAVGLDPNRATIFYQSAVRDGLDQQTFKHALILTRSMRTLNCFGS